MCDRPQKLAMPGSMNTLLDDWADSKFQTCDDERLGPGSSFSREADGGKSSEYKEIKGPGSTQKKLEYRKQWGSITYEKLMKKNGTSRATRRWILPNANT